MVFTASRMLLGLSPFEGLGASLIGGGEIRGPLTFSRAQAAGVEATGDV